MDLDPINENNDRTIFPQSSLYISVQICRRIKWKVSPRVCLKYYYYKTDPHVYNTSEKNVIKLINKHLEE